jgi:hypothetical protein
MKKPRRVFFACPSCGWEDLRYPNLKKCPKCHKGVLARPFSDAERIKSLRELNAAFMDRVELWVQFAHEVGKKVNCLPSIFPDSNTHILSKIDALITDRDAWKAAAERCQGNLETVQATALETIRLSQEAADLRAAALKEKLNHESYVSDKRAAERERAEAEVTQMRGIINGLVDTLLTKRVFNVLETNELLLLANAHRILEVTDGRPE